MDWKAIGLWVLPAAGLIGTWIGFAAGDAAFSLRQCEGLFLFALWSAAGFFWHWRRERTRMNRTRGYR
ncbi:MAG TPA: hypothetical protein VFK27_06710 [Bacillales bacterium]|nr:hypothetical protein [Bacillales bacterium]